MTWLWVPILIMWMFMVVQGYQRGFVKIIVSFLLSIVLILLLNPIIEDVIVRETPILQQLEEFFQGVAVLSFGGEAEGSSVQQREFLNQIPLLAFVKENLLENNNETVYQLFRVDSFLEYLAGYFARFVVKIISLLVAVLLTKILVKITGYLWDRFGKFSIMGFFDRVGGMFLGAAKGILYLWMIFLVVSVFASTSVGSYLHMEIVGDPYLNYLYQNNAIIQYIVAMITV